MKRRQSRPGIEALEERALLSGGARTVPLGASLSEIAVTSNRTHTQAVHHWQPGSMSALSRIVPDASSANQVVFRYSVSGITFATTNYTGTRIPVGSNVVAQRPITALIFPGNGQNGFNGQIQATERVVRFGKTSTFTGTSSQTFTGVAMLDGSPYTGSFTQVLKFKGLLNPNLGVNDPAQAAQTFTGTWKIIRGSGALTNLRGHGTLNWPGGMVPVDYSGTVTI